MKNLTVVINQVNLEIFGNVYIFSFLPFYSGKAPKASLEKVETWATPLSTQRNSYQHMQNFDICAARAL